MPILICHSSEIVTKRFWIVVDPKRLMLSLAPDSELLPKTRSAGTPIAPRIAVDNFSWSETDAADDSFLIVPARNACWIVP